MKGKSTNERGTERGRRRYRDEKGSAGWGDLLGERTFFAWPEDRGTCWRGGGPARCLGPSEKPSPRRLPWRDVIVQGGREGGGERGVKGGIEGEKDRKRDREIGR